MASGWVALSSSNPRPCTSNLRLSLFISRCIESPSRCTLVIIHYKGIYTVSDGKTSRNTFLKGEEPVVFLVFFLGAAVSARKTLFSSHECKVTLWTEGLTPAEVTGRASYSRLVIVLVTSSRRASCVVSAALMVGGMDGCLVQCGSRELSYFS